MTDAVKKLPAVGRIRGVHLQTATTAALSVANVQYTDLSGSWYELTMPLLDAIALLNMLEEASKRSGFDHLRRPPA